MRTFSFFRLTVICSVLVAPLLSTPTAWGQEQNGLQGWEADSAYNHYYNAKELDRLKGTISKFVEVTPLPGMARGTAFYLDEAGGEEILVHLCPTAYAEPDKTGLRRGVETKIRGSWAYINDQDVFLAAKVKQGEHFEFKVRLTSDGTPFWSMSAEQIAKEQSDN
ncbi:MAG: hypothetical protein ACK5PS_09860 [Desulfopila sp.]